jgi:hypothetical protein
MATPPEMTKHETRAREIATPRRPRRSFREDAMTQACDHDLDVTLDADYEATCRSCGLHLPCDDCAWASACIMILGECCKEANERRQNTEETP